MSRRSRALASGCGRRATRWRGWPATGQLAPADNLAAGREVLAKTGSLYADVPRRLRARLDLPAATESAPGPGGGLADLPRLQPHGRPAPRRLALGGAGDRILVAGQPAGLAAPDAAGRLPGGRSCTGVPRIRQ